MNKSTKSGKEDTVFWGENFTPPLAHCTTGSSWPSEEL